MTQKVSNHVVFLSILSYFYIVFWWYSSFSTTFQSKILHFHFYITLHLSDSHSHCYLWVKEFYIKHVVFTCTLHIVSHWQYMYTFIQNIHFYAENIHFLIPKETFASNTFVLEVVFHCSFVTFSATGDQKVHFSFVMVLSIISRDLHQWAENIVKL